MTTLTTTRARSRGDCSRMDTSWVVAVTTLLVVVLSLESSVVIGSANGNNPAAVRHAFLKAAMEGSAIQLTAPKLRDNEFQRRARRSNTNNNNNNQQENADVAVNGASNKINKKNRQLYNYWYNKNYNNDDGANEADNADEKQAIDWSEVGFEITKYSVRYMGCSQVLSYSDDLAKSDSTNVLQARRFAVFRLCPTFYCNPYSLTGCESDYGEYAVDLDTYLQTIAEYDNDLTDTFCAYCSACNVTNTTSNGSACNSSACKNATTICTKSTTTYQASDYFSCTAVESQSDGKTYYLGPHCGSDSYTIAVDVYTDQYCNNYTGSSVKVSDVLDGSIHQNALDYLPKKCVSCKETKLAWQEVASDGSDSDGVSEICEVLYEDSAKCNQHLTHGSSSSSSYSAKLEEQIACNFIHNLANGTYNERGEITLEQYTFNSTNWKSEAEYLKAAHYARATVSPWYIVGLTGVLLACAIMLSWACCLHRALARRNVPWRPKRGKNTDPTAISRQNSGIVLGRSRSGFGAASPLI